MSAENLTIVVTFILALSVASERLVEIIKGFFPWLDEKKDTLDDEALRRALLHILAMVAGIVTASLAWFIDVLPASLPTSMTDKVGAIFAFGLLASGGSGFWNSILDYVNRVKDIKKAEVKQVTAAANEEVKDVAKSSSETKPRKNKTGSAERKLLT
jgi:hypothetical protein